MRLARRRPPSRPDKWPNVDSPIRDWPLLQEPTFRGRLAEAVREGILLGVKLALAVGLVLLGVSYLLNDYNIVRQRARSKRHNAVPGDFAWRHLCRLDQSAHCS